ncbi:MAG: hypothetical protein WC069_04310 [Candidatus Shapirobacteria bacterium]
MSITIGLGTSGTLPEYDLVLRGFVSFYHRFMADYSIMDLVEGTGLGSDIVTRVDFQGPPQKGVGVISFSNAVIHIRNSVDIAGPVYGTVDIW